MLVLELARCTYLEQRENVIALGPSGTGKTQHALQLLDERLPPHRVGPAEQLLGLLPAQIETVQSRPDRLAAAHQPEPLAGPADQAAQGPARRRIRPD